MFNYDELGLQSYRIEIVVLHVFPPVPNPKLSQRLCGVAVGLRPCELGSREYVYPHRPCANLWLWISSMEAQVIQMLQNNQPGYIAACLVALNYLGLRKVDVGMCP